MALFCLSMHMFCLSMQMSNKKEAQKETLKEESQDNLHLSLALYVV